MSAVGRPLLLVCPALLGALLISCGDSPVPAAPPELSPGVAEETVITQGPGDGEDADAANGQQPGDERGPTGQQAPPDDPGGARLGGDPPGVELEIPRIGQDFSNKPSWDQAIDQACEAVDLRAGCLTLSLTFFEVHVDQYGDIIDDKPEPIRENPPTPEYRSEDPRYIDCFVTDMDPLITDDSGPVTVPAWSAIEVEITCTRADDGSTDPGEATDDGSGA